MGILVNHVGYEPTDRKHFLFEPGDRVPVGTFSLVETSGGQMVFQGRLEKEGGVPGWKSWSFFSGNFSDLVAPGRYAVSVPLAEGEPLRSDSFEVAEGLYRRELPTDLLHYFKGQRASHVWDRADRSARLWGTEERYDVHGGWYDASGDTSKYLSHLSYANFMNPQQTPLVVWNFLHAAGGLADLPAFFQARLLDETLHGADFLVRMQHPSGAFFMTLFDTWSKDPDQRDLCEYATRKGTKSSTWQASYRQGGGMAVAALARASVLSSGGDFSTDRYLEAAWAGFRALEVHGPQWCNDGRENLLDDYCALLAATELFAASGHLDARAAAVRRAQSLVGRLTHEGWWATDGTLTRSFFHASDAGLPVLALLRFQEVLGDDAQAAQIPVLPTIEASLRFELGIDAEVTNPFGYPRHFVRTPGHPDRTLFFIPHDNESGYWWQGENARLGSLAAAGYAAAEVLPGLADLLRARSADCLDWILGRNPFDLCMMHGKGHNNPQYEPGYYPAPGGVCNGITSEIDDEEGIAFHTTEEVTPWESWRWGEQWLPHGAWLFLAVALRPRAVAP